MRNPGDLHRRLHGKAVARVLLTAAAIGAAAAWTHYHPDQVRRGWEQVRAALLPQRRHSFGSNDEAYRARRFGADGQRGHSSGSNQGGASSTAGTASGEAGSADPFAGDPMYMDIDDSWDLPGLPNCEFVPTPRGSGEIVIRFLYDGPMPERAIRDKIGHVYRFRLRAGNFVRRDAVEEGPWESKECELPAAVRLPDADAFERERRRDFHFRFDAVNRMIVNANFYTDGHGGTGMVVGWPWSD